jgi:hypothetical protein
MVSITKDKVTFTRDLWEELRKNSSYSELIEDIEDRMELESAIKTQKDSGEEFEDFDDYDRRRMKRVNGKKKKKDT